LLQLKEKKSSINAFYDNFDRRIKKKQSILNHLSRLEEMSYSPLVSVSKKANLNFSYNEENRIRLDSSPSPSTARLHNRRPAPLNISCKPAIRLDYVYLNYVAKIPERWEINGVKIAISHLKNTNIKVHFSKLCSAAALNKIRNSKNKNFSCDVSCNYLFFDENDIKDGDSKFKDFPPIRSKENKQLLRDMLKIKSIKLVASHHASIPFSLKSLNNGSFLQSLSGINSLGYVLQTCWTVIKESESYEKW
jgi:hypothetical protein